VNGNFEEWDVPRQEWMLTGGFRSSRRRTLLLEVTTRVLFPTVLVFSLYLLLVGHHGPGGGFAGGLVAGLALVLRFLAGGDQDLGAAVPVRPPVLVGAGLAVAIAAALVPVASGAAVLATTELAVDVPLVGHVTTRSSLLLDVGVYLLVVGAVLELLRSLGSGIERDMQDSS
jgi:multicomponent Na+:H+ antiporter subunit B